MGRSDIKHVLGALRRADNKFNLIQNGDRICVGVSGGKDSLLLLFALSIYKQFSKKDFSLLAVTVHLGFEPFNTDGIKEFCDNLGVEYKVIKTDIGEVVFNVKQEKNPCSLCANMRRGALNGAATEAGCNKVALAHHFDDAYETLFMSLFYEGRINTLPPKSFLTRQDLTVIRPLLFVPEEIMTSCAEYNNLPVLKNPCPADGYTKRSEMKEFLLGLEKQFPHVKKHAMSALTKTENYNLWDKYVCKEQEDE